MSELEKQEVTRSEIGRQIDSLLVSYYVSYDVLARLCHVETQSVLNWIHGETRPTDEELDRVAEVLDVSAKDLYACRERDDKAKHIADLYSEVISRAANLGFDELNEVLTVLRIYSERDEGKKTNFSKQVKIRLVEMGKSQVWLIEQVKAKTGLYFDGGYLWRIMSGEKSTPTIVEAIREILDLPKEV